MSAEGVALVSAGAALGGVAVTQAANFILEKRREREWYRKTVFDRRLNASQQAYAWWRKLNEAIANAGPTPDPDGEACATVRELAKQARDWYDNNSLYLEGALTGSSDFVGLTNAAIEWASGHTDVRVQASLREVHQFVRRLANRLLAAETATAERLSHA